MKRGQLALDNVTISAIVFVILTGFIVYSYVYFDTSYNVVEMKNTLNELALTADTISMLAPGTRDVVVVAIPKDVRSVSVTGNAITANIGSGNKASDVEVGVRPQVVGSVPITQGTHYIGVKVVGNGIVKIGNGPWITGLVPTNTVFNQLPITVKILGEDFVSGADVLLNGGIYPVGFVTFINSGEIQFTAIPGQMPAAPGGKVYNISAANPNGEVSNIQLFTVYPV